MNAAVMRFPEPTPSKKCKTSIRDDGIMVCISPKLDLDGSAAERLGLLRKMNTMTPAPKH